jgi:hypothetical protein
LTGNRKSLVFGISSDLWLTDYSPSADGRFGFYFLRTCDPKEVGGSVDAVTVGGGMAQPLLMPNGEAPWGVTEERAEHDVFDHGPDGRLVFVQTRRDTSVQMKFRLWSAPLPKPSPTRGGWL